MTIIWWSMEVVTWLRQVAHSEILLSTKEENVLPSLRWSTSAADFICQHDNASIYTAKVTKAWFEDKNVYIGQLNHPISTQ